MRGSVALTVGGSWRDGSVEGGDRWAPRQVDLTRPVTIGRSRENDVRLPDAAERFSRVAAVVVANGPEVRLQVRNLPGAMLLAADGHTAVFPREVDPARARWRRDVLVYDGDVLWLPPEPLLAEADVLREGGYWLELALPSVAPEATDDPPAARGEHPITTYLAVNVGDSQTFDVPLDVAQRVILTAVCAEAIAPIPGRAYWRASTADEVAAMVWSVDEFRTSRRDLERPNTKAIEQRIQRLVQKLESYTKTVLPEPHGSWLNQRLAFWCKSHVPDSWFDRDLAERLLAIRSDLEG